MNTIIESFKNYYSSRIGFFLLNLKRLPYFSFRLVKWILAIISCSFKVLIEGIRMFKDEVFKILGMEESFAGVGELNGHIKDVTSGKEQYGWGDNKLKLAPFEVIKPEDTDEEEFFINEKDESGSAVPVPIKLTPLPYFMWILKAKMHLKYKVDKDGKQVGKISPLFYGDSEFLWDWESTLISKIIMIMAISAITGISYTQYNSNKRMSVFSPTFKDDLTLMCYSAKIAKGHTPWDELPISLMETEPVDFMSMSRIKTQLNLKYTDTYMLDLEEGFIPNARFQSVFNMFFGRMYPENFGNICADAFNSFRGKFNKKCVLEVSNWNRFTKEQKLIASDYFYDSGSVPYKCKGKFKVMEK